MAVNCTSLEQVRENIDRLDRQIVALLAERGGFVSQAARFKKDS
ncbi:MAG: chorismate mutase, partial [Pseudomonadota bacterium]|nr:chorismate mutase [Pseudomonadota bacterium]